MAGLTLARGLIAQQHLQTTVYEASEKYLDVGAGLAFHGNAMRALENIDKALHNEYFARATLMADREKELATTVLIGDEVEGEEKILAELGKAKGRKTVARADLLEGLYSLLPKDVVHFGWRLNRIEEEDGSGEIALAFDNGKTARTDVLISADGIHSVTRKYLLGADHPAASPVNHDRWSFVMRKVPAAEVKALNPGLLDRVPIFCGSGGCLNSIPVRFGEEMTVTAYSQDLTADTGTGTTSPLTTEDSGSTDAAAATRAKFDKALDNFNTWRKDCRDLAELIRRDPSAGWPIADHDPAPFYARGRICIVGDAAHATFPFNGQGAAQAVEDAAVLNALFREVRRLDVEVEAALRAYDEVRRPRSQKVAALSRQFGRMYAFIEPGVGGPGRDLDGMRRIMGAGGTFTNNIDLDAQNEAAVLRFKAAVKEIRD
jgi:salicylate hydroxylase